MAQGEIFANFDVAQLVLYAFWIFFAGLIYYLRSEDKREGYPLVPDTNGRAVIQGWPAVPGPKTFLLQQGGRQVAPRVGEESYPIKADPVAGFIGAPLEPTGNPMVDGVGPAAYAMRADIPDALFDGQPRIVPLRNSSEHVIAPGDSDPRGMEVTGADGDVAGTVTDAWVDRAECILRYYEVEVPGASGARRVLLPVNFTRVEPDRRRVRVSSILAAQFGQVPGTAAPDLVTRREEDRICAYYGSGHLYATPMRKEPLL